MRSRIYIDSEFNGFRGELISFAAASDSGKDFYSVIGLPKKIHPWVKENIIPKLNANSVGFETTRADFTNFVLRDLGLKTGDELQVFADWPEDLVHMFSLLSDEQGMTRFNFTVAGIFITPPRPVISDNAHNALADAQALRKAWLVR